MTKRWSSTRSDLLKTKRQASKDARNAAKRELDIEDCDGALAAELRRGVGTGNPDDVREAEELMDKAADEIERLRSDKNVIRSQERNAAYEGDIAQLEAERDQAVANLDVLALEVGLLQAELAEWKQAAKVEANLRREFFDDRERLRSGLACVFELEPEKASNWRYNRTELVEIAKRVLEQSAPRPYSVEDRDLATSPQPSKRERPNIKK